MGRVEYREMHCKSVLQRVYGMPFAWSINPYRGCVHSCHYCYARGTHTYLDHNAGEDFSSIIYAKVNAPQVLRGELLRPSWRHENVSIGTATDPYQPAEGRFRITRRLLEIFHECHTPASIVTKGTLVLRDIDVLRELTLRSGCTVCVSIPTVDRAIWRATEPGTAPPEQRLRAVARLVAAGIHAGVLAAPILPGISATPEKLEATVRAAAAHGARFFWAGILHLDQPVREHFQQFLQAEYPALEHLYLRLYPGKYAPRPVEGEIQRRVSELKARYQLVDRERTDPRPAQLALQ